MKSLVFYDDFDSSLDLGEVQEQIRVKEIELDTAKGQQSVYYANRKNLEEAEAIRTETGFADATAMGARIDELDKTLTDLRNMEADLLAGIKNTEQAINDVCMEMGETEDLDAVMERYQALLDESDAMDADNHEVNIRRQLKLAELEDKEDLTIENLSGGELKLVQIIRQMLRHPGLLIMDEPDVFLDFENLAGLRELINDYVGSEAAIAALKAIADGANE